MSTEILAKMADLRAAGICDRAGPWLEENGMSWRQFVRQGIPVERLEATGDPRAIRVAKKARERHGRC